VGEYDVGFRLDGFQPLTFRRVAIHVNDRVQLPATLRVGLAQAVAVRAEESLQRTSATQTLLRPSDLQQLPLLNRHFVQLVPLVPGVSSNLVDELTFCMRDDLWISINGARRSAVNWLLDGTSNVDVGTNATLLATSSLDAIQEVKVITSNPTAEWARSGGGVVHVVTKSGTNRFSGTAFEFFRHDALNATPVSLFPERQDPAVRLEPPRLRYSDFGATLGGPALPSRKNLFFFSSAEWRRSSRDPVVGTFEVPDPAWLTDSTSPHYVPPEDRDPLAVKLLALWPAPNVPGQSRYRTSFPMPDDMRQQVVRVDHELKPGWSWTARMIFDNDQFFDPVPSRFNGASNIDVAGRVGVVQLRTAKGRWWNEFSYSCAGRRLKTTNARIHDMTRDALGLKIPELFPENPSNLMPNIDIQGSNVRLARSLAFQPSDTAYRDNSFADHFTFARGDHTIKTGGLVTFERRTEWAGQGISHGQFVFINVNGRTGFQNFMRGQAYTYFEDDIDLTNDLRFGRYEAYVQDTWTRRRFTFDLGVRYSMYTPVYDDDGRLATFSPETFDLERTSDQLNGVVVAGPGGGALYRTDTNNVQPRIGASWDIRGDGNSIARAAYGVYFDQPQANLFRSDYSDDAVIRQVQVQNAPLTDPNLGERFPPFPIPPTRHAVSENFTTPRIQQWSIGLQHRLYRSGTVDVSYVGSDGDHLIRPIDINREPLLNYYGAEEPVPYPGQRSIIMYESIGTSSYHGLLTSFRHEAGRGLSLVVNYTLSRSQADATEDANFDVDQPQDPLNVSAEFADTRTDRRHIFTTYFNYTLPFLKDSTARLWRALAAGWQIAGIGTITSGPAARVMDVLAIFPVTGIRPDQVGDPGAGDQEGMFWFDPKAFRPATAGNYGTAPVAPFRLPGRHQWDLSISKNVGLGATRHLQVRVDLINAFNQVNFIQVNTTCAGVTSCSQFNPNFGRVMSAHAPRQVQLGIRATW